MKIDLHTHSTASDGSLSPTELVERAGQIGIEFLSLTDHDNVDGISEFMEAGRRTGIMTLPGIEFSVDHGAGSIHLLGYGIDPENAGLISIISELKHARQDRNWKIINRLRGLGVKIDIEMVGKFARNGVVGRPHIAKAMVAINATTTIAEAFERFLKNGGPAYIERQRLSLSEACNLIHQAGGITVWAHPGLLGMSFNTISRSLANWQSQGLDGLESDYSGHTAEFSNRIRTIARDHAMITTGGSDYHGSYRLGVELGQGPEGDVIREDCVAPLLQKIQDIRSASR